MDTPIEAIYRAAKEEIPAEGDYLTRIAGSLQSAITTLDRQTAHAGEPALMTSMLRVGGDIYDVLHLAVRSLDNASLALIMTADDFVNTDDEARADYEKLSGDLKDAELPHHSTEELGDPEAPGYDVEHPMPMPPGSTHVDPSVDPVTPDQDSEARDAGEDPQPELPEAPGRDWE
ncbi:hypothetical protein [Nocardioides sambongensis]|uniref:hypothetical protein n=1 Tax=Nocardioides sambongensis TaxID=2589074 RepID=UPI001129464C|nr:hypothetical protein [Nocardioides sambongensis]